MYEIFLSKLSDKFKHSTIRITCEEEWERDHMIVMAVQTVLKAEENPGPTRELQLHTICNTLVGLPPVEPLESFDGLTEEESRLRADKARREYEEYKLKSANQQTE
jgi:hypothetical protein